MTDLTDGRRIYAVGDIHGCLDLLTEMVARIRADLAARPHPHPLIVFLGDYVDRGPDSRGVIEALLALRSGAIPTAFLLGNHDRYVQAYLREPEWYDLTYHWLADNLGGARTLASYGVEGASPARAGGVARCLRRGLPAEPRRLPRFGVAVGPAGGLRLRPRRHPARRRRSPSRTSRT